MLAYRLRYVTGILTYLLFVSVNFFIWDAVFAGRSAQETIHGYTLEEMVTYIVVAWVSRSLYHSNIDYEINELVRSGDVRNYLLRPVNFQMLMLSQALGETIFRAAFFTLPVGLVIIWLFPIQAPVNSSALAWFTVATLVAFFILVNVNFIVGMLAFRFKSVIGLIMAKYQIVLLCSGLLLPLPFFPSWARDILEWLPFQAITYIPLQVYLGKLPANELMADLGFQAGWCILLFIAGHYSWKRAFARLSVQGG
jgi:ABC-2 type transport system permease protein